MALVNSTRDTLKNLRDRTDRVWSSRFLRHPERVYCYNPGARTGQKDKQTDRQTAPTVLLRVGVGYNSKSSDIVSTRSYKRQTVLSRPTSVTFERHRQAAAEHLIAL